jgi:hypothetical protein
MMNSAARIAAERRIFVCTRIAGRFVYLGSGGGSGVLMGVDAVFERATTGQAFPQGSYSRGAV